MPKSSKPRKRTAVRSKAARVSDRRLQERPAKEGQKMERFRHVRRVPLFPGKTGGR